MKELTDKKQLFLAGAAEFGEHDVERVQLANLGMVVKIEHRPATPTGVWITTRSERGLIHRTYFGLDECVAVVAQ